jgi:hypothetical protein
VGPRAGFDAVEKKYLAPAGNRSAAVQPIARLCADSEKIVFHTTVKPFQQDAGWETMKNHFDLQYARRKMYWIRGVKLDESLA